MKKKKEEDLEAVLIREYEHWEHLRDSGGTDPFYDDSGGMNLVRNLCHKDLLDKKEGAAISIENVLGYVSGLAWALKEDDLAAMRRHASRPESYQESFAHCARQAEKIISGKEKEAPGQENCEQMTLFQFGLDSGQCR